MKKSKSSNPIRRKFAVTLVELIVVMSLIAIITGAIAFNYKRSLDEGKSFKTKQALEKISRALSIAVAEEPALIASFTGTSTPRGTVEGILSKSPLIQDASTILVDGWGGPIEVTVAPHNRTPGSPTPAVAKGSVVASSSDIDVTVTSAKLTAYLN